MAREVLLSDGYLAALPALSDVVEQGEHDAGEDGVEAERRQETIDDLLRRRLVIRGERVGELALGLLALERGSLRVLGGSLAHGRLREDRASSLRR